MRKEKKELQKWASIYKTITITTGLHCSNQNVAHVSTVSDLLQPAMNYKEDLSSLISKFSHWYRQKWELWQKQSLLIGCFDTPRKYKFTYWLHGGIVLRFVLWSDKAFPRLLKNKSRFLKLMDSNLCSSKMNYFCFSFFKIKKEQNVCLSTPKPCDWCLNWGQLVEVH